MFCIRDKTPTNANNGTAIAVHASIPVKAVIAFEPAILARANDAAILSIRIPNDAAAPKADSIGN